MSRLKELEKEIEERGNVFIGELISIEDIDYIIKILKIFWKNEEIIIFCGNETTEKIFELFNDNSKASVSFNLETSLCGLCLSEGSFSRNGLTFHIVEKPNMKSKSIWVAFSEKSEPDNSLLINLK